ncbi:MAG TPA: hypothetical protein VFE47_17465 [Tepidisphaeraceae bacterium]|jgi:DNA-binding transcriptional regulator LsrR (DeoR family)|nr:hypothetical protein [Tepidisphaeraceae bacterium]
MQQRAADAYFSDEKPTQAEVAKRFGIKQPALSRRLARYAEARGEYRYKFTLPRVKRRVFSLSDVFGY